MEDIIIRFTKADVDGMIVDVDENGNDIYGDLTDDQWERVVNMWRKCDNGIMQECWDLLEMIIRDIKAQG